MKSRPSKNSSVSQAKTPKQSVAAAAGLSGSAVFLVGFMGAGKSTVGRALAERLNWLFEDLDDRIEARERRSVAEIFRDSGEAEFRRAERVALQNLIEELHGGIARIVALGGGAYAQPENATLLRATGIHTVFLDAPVEELWRRCQDQATNAAAERPLLSSADRFRELYEARRIAYANASLHTETSGRTVDEIAAEIASALHLKRIELRTEEGDVE